MGFMQASRHWLQLLGTKRHLLDRRGAAAVEFAMLAPFLLILTMAITEVTAAYQIKQRMARLELTLADLVGRSATLNASQIDDIFTASDLLLAPYPTDPLTVEIRAIRIDAAGDGSILWARRSDGAVASSGPVTNLPQGLGIDRDLIEITTNYPYSLNFLFIGITLIDFGQSSYILPRIVALDSWNNGV